jgi:DNA mismatch endonuclease (patch repair protein)
MSRIRSQETSPEMLLRKALWTAGLRYRLKNKLPGKPDIIFPSAKVAVFVDGCFWHGCPLHGKVPKSNQSFWVKKFTRNIVRDLAASSALSASGWLELRFWEHEIEKELVSCVFRVLQAVRDRQGTSICATNAIRKGNVIVT